MQILIRIKIVCMSFSPLSRCSARVLAHESLTRAEALDFVLALDLFLDIKCKTSIKYTLIILLKGFLQDGEGAGAAELEFWMGGDELVDSFSATRKSRVAVVVHQNRSTRN